MSAAAPTTGDTRLAARLDETARAERRQALRALLAHPLLTAAGPRAEAFALVRRHREWLRQWLGRTCGWSLQLDSEVARLRKVPADTTDATRPARDPKTEIAFTRRGYVILCLALAVLERGERQTTLGRLAEEVIAAAAADPELAAADAGFDLSGRAERRELVQAMRLLLELQVLTRVHGDERQYIAGEGDVLYNVRRPALAAMLSVRRGPSTVEADSMDDRIAGILEEPLPTGDEGRNRRTRLRLMRRLLDDPVVYEDELTGDERAYLASQRGHLLREIEEATGLVPEVRAEGIALADERGDATDLDMPEEGTDGHLALLVAEYLAAHVAGQGRTGAGPVGTAALEQHVAGLIERHHHRWRRDVTEPGAERALLEQTLARFEALRLVRRTDEGVVPRPAIARYALEDPDGDEPSADAAGDPPGLWSDA